MESEEPAAGLINTFGYEIGGINLALFKSVFVFKWIVDLSVWHRTGVEPHVDKVFLAAHRLA